MKSIRIPPLESWRPAVITTPVVNKKGEILFQPGAAVQVRLDPLTYLCGYTIFEVLDAKDEGNPFLVSGESVEPTL